ncbi:MAG: nucleoside triphosphate pyrophosphohydrolase [Bacteroidales bacterium]|nr:nucleoside triphosphate pyrophosphohydrolase [Bacteroidales bacterium]
MDKRLEAFKRLLDIMDDLRAGCPWDKKQTIESLRHLTIEETFELSEAIIASDYQDVKKELGDLIMHIVFYSKIADERGLFDISDVINSICDKLIVRHPHIYGTEKVETAEEVLQNWEKIKIKKEGNRSVLGGVPAGLPPLLKAYRMTDKASGVGFDWENKDDCWKKVLEEMDELQEVVRNDETKERKDEEFGDLLFALVNYSRFIKVNADDALEHANAKFKRRFTYIEDRAREMGRSVADMTLDEMEELWQKAKSEENPEESRT